MSRSSERLKKFEYIDHPADIAFRVYGRTLVSLFKNAAQAIYDILKPHKSSCKRVYIKKDQISSDSLDGLLVLFLNEILYLALEKHLIFTKILIKISWSRVPNILKYEMIGHKIDDVAREIKAVTYHNLKIRRISNYYQADIIVDI
ncbi:MAG: archease [Candidatus Omnitrophica bacterium]|nr:archease [Candidatus Omnitrophota bacterium]